MLEHVYLLAVSSVKPGQQNVNMKYCSVVLLISAVISVGGVQIRYQDICGNKLHDSCPNAVNTKIVGGDSSCAEKVPWNVLVEKISEQSTGEVLHSDQIRQMRQRLHCKIVSLFFCNKTLQDEVVL